MTWVLQGQFWMVSIVHHSDIVCKRFWDLFAIFLRPFGIISQRGVECKCILGKPGWTEGGGGGIMGRITDRKGGV